MLRTSLAKINSSSLRRIHSSSINYSFFDQFGSTLKADLKKSMLAKDHNKKDTIKLIRSELKNFEIDTKGKENSEFGISKVLNKMIKSREKSISEYSSLNREDLVGQEEAQKQVLLEYLNSLPIASEDEIKEKVQQLITEKGKSGKELLKEVELGKLAEEWKTSEAVIRRFVFSGGK